MSPDRYAAEESGPAIRSIGELNGNLDWFHDSSRPASQNEGDRLGRHVVVEDDFYDLDDSACLVGPGALRGAALSSRFYQYYPPRREDFDAATFERILCAHPGFAGPDPALGFWQTTALNRFAGHELRSPRPGFRFNPEWLRAKLSKLLGEVVLDDGWEWGGDWWNGAFHLIDADFAGGAIHHHWKSGDVEPRGWSGVVYLSPAAPPESGTSVVMDRRTGKCVGSYESAFGYDWSHCHRLHRIENRFNRLVLFRENVLHAAERGFGHGRQARLTQTFFFRTRKG